MNREFDKKVMLENISYLIREKERKIGELETEAGVSAGYISRIQKDASAKPGIDFVVRIAAALNMTVDTLLFTNLVALTPTERYLISFIEKLKGDTSSDKLSWNRESREELNNLTADDNGYVDHNLFEIKTFVLDDLDLYEQQITKVAFQSQSFGCSNFIDDDCYNLRMKNDTILYLMHIEKCSHPSADPDAHAIELWMYDGRKAHFLCSDRSSPELSTLIHDMYFIVGEYAKHPKLNKELRRAIDAFMQDDLEDDQETAPDEQPF